jgi:hypothetical protein
MQGQ